LSYRVVRVLFRCSATRPTSRLHSSYSSDLSVGLLRFARPLQVEPNLHPARPLVRSVLVCTTSPLCFYGSPDLSRGRVKSPTSSGRVKSLTSSGQMIFLRLARPLVRSVLLRSTTPEVGSLLRSARPSVRTVLFGLSPRSTSQTSLGVVAELFPNSPELFWVESLRSWKFRLARPLLMSRS
jgi:hypothetical protein